MKLPQKQKSILIREVNTDTYESYFDYWFNTQLMQRQFDEVHTIWRGCAPSSKEKN